MRVCDDECWELTRQIKTTAIKIFLAYAVIAYANNKYDESKCDFCNLHAEVANIDLVGCTVKAVFFFSAV